MKVTLNITNKYSRKGRITVNDSDEYFAEVTDNKHGFKVIDKNGKIILISVLYQPSRFKAFLGLGEHQIKEHDSILAHIKYHGFLGIKRSIDIGGRKSPLPRKHLFKLLNGNFSYDRKDHTVTYFNDTDLPIQPIIGICFYWLLRQVGMENMG